MNVRLFVVGKKAHEYKRYKLETEKKEGKWVVVTGAAKAESKPSKTDAAKKEARTPEHLARVLIKASDKLSFFLSLYTEPRIFL